MGVKKQKPPFRGTPAIKTPPYDGSAAWYVKVAGRIATAMCADPINRDLQAVSRAFAALSTAARGYIQRAELEAEVAELRKQVLDMMEARRYGSRVTRPADARSAAIDGSDPPVH